MATKWRAAVLILFHFSEYKSEETFSFPRRYILNTTTLTWYQASTACAASGGVLATIYDISTIPDLGLQGSNVAVTFWIGLHYNVSNLKYYWSSGDEVTWYNWQSEHLRNETGLCVAANSSQPYSWIRCDCDRNLPFLCQISGGECRFDQYPNRAISSHKYMFMNGMTAEQCLRACLQILGNRCQSFDYNLDGRCELNNGNMWTPDQYYHAAPGWIYFHRTCNTGASDETFLITSSTVFNKCIETSLLTHHTYITNEIHVSREVIITSTHTITVTVHETASRAITSSTVTVLPSNIITEDPVKELRELGENAKEKKKILTKISVENARPSAKYVGFVAITFLALVFGSIIVFDILSVFRNRDICGTRKRKSGSGTEQKSNEESLIEKDNKGMKSLRNPEVLLDDISCKLPKSGRRAGRYIVPQATVSAISSMTKDIGIEETESGNYHCDMDTGLVECISNDNRGVHKEDSVLSHF